MKLKHLFLGISLSLASIASHAAAIRAMPVRVQADSTVKAGVFQLVNPSSESVTYQVTLYKWSEKDGKNVFEETQDIQASPEMVKLEPGARRALRFMRVAMNPTQSQYYKLMLQELPPAPDKSAAKTGKASFHTIIVFKEWFPMGFEPKDAAPAHLTATVKDGKLMVTNDGGKAWVMQSIGLPGQKPLKDGALGWVLPNGGLQFDIKASSGQSFVISDGKNTQTLTVQ